MSAEPGGSNRDRDRDRDRDRADVVVVGAGLAGLVTATELARRGHDVALLDQEGEQDLGGQAFWSFGGLLLVDSPEQRLLRVRDTAELAWRDWSATAGWDRPDDEDGRRWAEQYVAFAADGLRPWLRSLGVRFFPIVGWAERHQDLTGRGNSVPRFHITWGTGPGLLAPFVRRVREPANGGRPVSVRHRHRVDELVLEGGVVRGVRGAVLAPTATERGQASHRTPVGEFEIRADAVVLATGGIGGDDGAVRRYWPIDRLGAPPADLLHGVPAHVDGRGLQIAAATGAHLVNLDRMWHYTEGLVNHSPVWDRHGIRILPGPSALWLDATGSRLALPALPGFDTLGTLEQIQRTGHPYSWFVMNRAIAEKEIALSGSEQNPDLTGRSVRGVLSRVLPGAPPPVRAFLDRGEDVAIRPTVPGLVAAMNEITGSHLLDPATVARQIDARDAELAGGVAGCQMWHVVDARRRYLGDRLIRVARPGPLRDSKSGPLVAVRLHVLTRKTLGGIRTEAGTGRVRRSDGTTIDGLYAAGEVSGFGGGASHGYRSLEGTFLGACLLTGRAVAADVHSRLG